MSGTETGTVYSAVRDSTEVGMVREIKQNAKDSWGGYAS